MHRKLIFLDIDGTLTPPGENNPPESALAAIRRARREGHLVCLCTGRNIAQAAPVMACGFDGAVTSAGGCVTAGEETLFDCPMTDAQRDTAITLLHGAGVLLTLEAKDATWVDEDISSLLHGVDAGNSELIRWRRALTARLGMRPMAAYDGRPLYKLILMCNDLRQLEPARTALERDFRFVMQDQPAHGIYNGEMVNRRFDKGLGVRLLAAHFGIPLADTIGFGDSVNDLEMMETVGVSVAMADGSPTLRARCSAVCPPLREDGLAQAFKRLLWAESLEETGIQLTQ